MNINIQSSSFFYFIIYTICAFGIIFQSEAVSDTLLFFWKMHLPVNPCAALHTADEEGPESDDEEEEEDNDVSPPLNPLDIDKLMFFTIILHTHAYNNPTQL